MSNPHTTDETGGAVLLPSRRVLKRYDRCSMTIERWLKDDRLQFPKPLYIGRNRYWRLSELEAWERSRAHG